jgi:hypothetical protein
MGNTDELTVSLIWYTLCYIQPKMKNIEFEAFANTLNLNLGFKTFILIF